MHAGKILIHIKQTNKQTEIAPSWLPLLASSSSNVVGVGLSLRTTTQVSRSFFQSPKKGTRDAWLEIETETVY